VPAAIKQEAKELLSQAVHKNNRPCLVAYNMLQILFENGNGIEDFRSSTFPNLPEDRPLIWESVWKVGGLRVDRSRSNPVQRERERERERETIMPRD
jgi:hypothetical protein